MISVFEIGSIVRTLVLGHPLVHRDSPPHRHSSKGDDESSQNSLVDNHSLARVANQPLSQAECRSGR
jgi:hypothetical protein